MGLDQHHKVAGVSLDSDLPAMDFADVLLWFPEMYLLGIQQIKFKDCGAPVPASFSRRKLFFCRRQKLRILQSNPKQTQPSKTHGNKNDNKEETLRVSLVGLSILSWHLLALPFPPRWYFCLWPWGAQRLPSFCALLTSRAVADCGLTMAYPQTLYLPPQKSYCLQQSVCLNQGSLLIIIYIVFFHDVQMPS